MVQVTVDRSRLAAFCRRYKISRLAPFGSVLKDSFCPGSDVDLLVEFQPGSIPGLFGMARMEKELSTNLGREVDLRTPKISASTFGRVCWQKQKCSMLRNETIRLLHMLDAAHEAIGFARGRTRSDLNDSRMLVLSLVKAIEIIGEAAYRISPATRAELQDIPWDAIFGMRHRLVHACFDINLDILWRIITDELPVLIDVLGPYLPQDESVGEFGPGSELEASLQPCLPTHGLRQFAH